MGYFDKFPNLYYDIKKNKRFEFVVDILRRLKINSNALNDQSLYGEYTIKDTDRPDTIAHKLYGDSELHWVILLFNEIHNPYYEWPMSFHDFNRYMEDKYPGKALIVELDVVKDSPIPSVRARRDHKILEGYYAYGITGDHLQVATGNKRAYVLCWDRTMQKAIVIDEVGTFAENNSIGFAITGNGEVTASGTVRRVQLNTEAIHHFVDDNQNLLAPYGTYSGEIQEGNTVQLTYSLDDYGRTAIVPFDQTLLGAYMENDSQTIVGVTNREHEEAINEARRSINLPAPEVIREFVSSFEQVINQEI